MEWHYTSMLVLGVLAVLSGVATWCQWRPGPFRRTAFLDRQNLGAWRMVFPNLTRRQMNRTIAIILWLAGLALVCCALLRPQFLNNAIVDAQLGFSSM